MRKLPAFLLFSLIAISSGLQASEEVTSANGGDRLKGFLERFDKSDLDGDGVLTVDEMHSFLDKKIKDGSVSDSKPTQSVNLKKLKGLKSRSYLNAFYIETSAECDINKDGQVTKNELLLYVLSQRKIINAAGEQVPHPKVAELSL